MKRIFLKILSVLLIVALSINMLRVFFFNDQISVMTLIDAVSAFDVSIDGLFGCISSLVNDLKDICAGFANTVLVFTSGTLSLTTIVNLLSALFNWVSAGIKLFVTFFKNAGQIILISFNLLKAFFHLLFVLIGSPMLNVV